MKMNKYIHGTTKFEQSRLDKLNILTNQSFMQYLGVNIDSYKICDFGCGLGILINDIAKKYPNANITGLEISPNQYKAALINNKKNLNVNVINIDALNSQLPNNSQDISFCRYVLEHVHEPVSLVMEMLRVTKTNGSIICQENDLHNTIFYPEIPNYDLIKESFCRFQIQLGGDPYVGRKLFTIFKNAGAREITLDYKPEIFTEDEPDLYKIWMENTLKILIGARDQLIKFKYADIKIFDDVCDKIQERIDNPIGVALFHWNRIKAKK
jgi:ubiquinone/menaquinone biosynthesis C-methylase UbiE